MVVLVVASLVLGFCVEFVLGTDAIIGVVARGVFVVESWWVRTQWACVAISVGAVWAGRILILRLWNLFVVSER